MSDILKESVSEDITLTDRYLDSLLPVSESGYKILTESMRYSLFAGGKRVRPFLTLEFAKLFGAEKQVALPYACALELVHTYSLIHDDLPCMDNDDIRRGKPTNHRVYGESTALLAGDSLLTLAFGCTSTAPLSPASNNAATALLSDYAGYRGMAGGQQMDLIGEKEEYGLDKLIETHSLKTGKLISCACLFGALAAGYFEGTKEYEAALGYSRGVGLAFQITDDILDVYGDTSSLGKTTGKDEKSNKSTFLTLMSKSAAEEYAKRVSDEAKAHIADFEGSEILTEFADSLLARIK